MLDDLGRVFQGVALFLAVLFLGVLLFGVFPPKFREGEDIRADPYRYQSYLAHRILRRFGWWWFGAIGVLTLVGTFLRAFG